MKVLYVGVYRDGDNGWAQAARDYILALDAAGVDVVPRAVRLNDARAPLHPRILELEGKSASGCDAVIQHLLPHQMDYDGRLFNVGLVATETSDYYWSGWPEHLNCMDAVWTPCEQNYQAALASGVQRPLWVIPHATDVKRFERTYAPLPLVQKLRDDGKFVFYTVGEYHRRKNLSAVVKAFHLEFDPSEPVELIIKAGKPGLPPGELYKHIAADCEKVKVALKLYPTPAHYKHERIITERMTERELMALHVGCDCFVQVSFGEAWSIPAFDAMAFGKTPIVTGAGGYTEYVSDQTGWLVDSREEPVVGALETFAELYTGRETWAVADVKHLRRCMREAYEREDLRKEKALAGMRRAYDFSHAAVGGLMKKALAHVSNALERRPRG